MTPQDWKKMRQVFLATLLAFTIVAAGISAYLFSPASAVITLCASIYLGIGFWITENLIGIFTKVKVANPTGVAFVMSAKLIWLGSLLFLARAMPKGSELPLAFGMGAFLVALLAATFSQYGFPKVSDAPGESRS